MTHYCVKLYEDEFTRIEGALLARCDGSSASLLLIAKIQAKRAKLVALNAAKAKHDKAPRKQHDKRLQGNGNGGTAAQDNAPRFNGASGVSVRLGVGPESKDAV